LGSSVNTALVQTLLQSQYVPDYTNKRDDLLTSFARSCRDGTFTDLTITCGPLTLPVQAVVVCSTCDFFRKSLSFATGREAESRCIDLPEDDPEVIRQLITYLSLGDYVACDGLEISRYANLRQHNSTTTASEKHHPRYRKGTFGSATFASDHYACLVPNLKNLKQLASRKFAPPTLPSYYKPVKKAPNTVGVENALTIHATMYALGDNTHLSRHIISTKAFGRGTI
jgi:hypothetical protein